VEEAARAAYAHDFITAMPKGYDTMIGAKAG
jgi:ATP-binding cassette subfamily B protein